MNMHQPKSAIDRDYVAIADHGLIGNLHTAAMVSTDGSRVESYCIPNFDSPSNKGGHFSVSPTVPFSTKQNYYPSSNVLQTKFMNERGVVSITDFLPRQAVSSPVTKKPLLPWLIRRVEVIRGVVPLRMECAPAFNYARSKHTTSIVQSASPASTTKAVFESDALALDLRYKGHLGLGVQGRNDVGGGTATNKYWNDWIRSWKEAVHRSALALKLLIFEPTGAVVARPYVQASWIRDSSFTLYALIRLGFTAEADEADGSLQIMYTIHGGKELEEIELTHLDGHKGSKPVRIGNGAADHLQLDIYGELMDCIYLGQKVSIPLELVAGLISSNNLNVVANCHLPDLYGGLRLADKRSLPCPHRNEWLAARDSLYEEIMNKAFNKVLIMPLVFFIQPSDPRFVNTLKQILKTPERGGLTANNLVFRYDVNKSDDGVGGEEGTFCLCTLWCVEALTRAGEYDHPMLHKAVAMFEDFLLYLNHVGLCTEEISEAGEGLGNAVQGFTHVTLISAAYNLSRTMQKHKY
ncbi:glycoside hydrolase family 15 protein [Mycena olivaceomarginata]|nr:glycoside hydrolase family 15 protein [Mycena olivaceomarginata]